MNGGRLTEVITIERPSIAQNDFGANNLQWQKHIQTRADVQYESGTRATENDEVIFSYNKIFTIRYYHDIDEQDRIIWNNKKWRILSIEPDKAKQLITIRTELINE